MLYVLKRYAGLVVVKLYEVSIHIYLVGLFWGLLVGMFDVTRTSFRASLETTCQQ